MTNFEPSPVGGQEAPSPFDSAPQEPSGGGCGRAGIIGCGVLTLLLGFAAIVFLLKAGDLFAWALSKFEVEITRALPEDLGEQDRQRLQEAFAAAGEAVQRGEFDPLALQRMQQKLRDSLLDEDQSLSREQVLELIQILEEVAGTAPPGEPVEEEAAPESPIAA